MIKISADPVPLQLDEHGTIRVAGTRLTLESLLSLYQQGKAPQEIAMCFAGITLGDVYAVLGYYLHHQVEVDAYLAEQEAASEAVWQELEAHGAAKANPFRERVLSQRSSQRGLSQQNSQRNSQPDAQQSSGRTPPEQPGQPGPLGQPGQPEQTQQTEG